VTVKVKFFASFRETFGARELDLALAPGATVGAVLDRLADTPSRRTEIFDGPALRPHIVLMINGDGLRPGSGLATALADGDILAVFPMMGGG
jgi:sulfur-carrier protein